MAVGMDKNDGRCRRGCDGITLGLLNPHWHKRHRIDYKVFARVAQSCRKCPDIDALLRAILDLRQTTALPTINMLTPFRRNGHSYS